MTISSISNMNSWLAQLDTANSTSSAQSDTAGTSGAGSALSQPPPGGGLMRSILEALSQIGVAGDSTSSGSSTATSGSSSTNSSSATDSQDVAAAMQQFMQSLMASLQAQSTNAASGTATSDASSSSSLQAVSGNSTGQASTAPGWHPHHRGGDLQAAVQKLASSDLSDSSATSDLQTSFNNLVSALGGNTDSSQTTMSNFLTTLASDLQTASPAGSFVSARV